MLRRLLAKKLDPDTVAALVAQERASVLAACTPVAVYLFGSAARGEMTDASDLDLLVVMGDAADLKEVKRRYYGQRRGSSWPVDIIFMRESDFRRKSTIGGVPMLCLQEGRIIHRGEP